MDIKKVVVIGCGGIGTHLVPDLARYLNYSVDLPDDFEMVLVDKDIFEPHNLERQTFDYEQIDKNKAETLQAAMKAMFPNLNITTFTEYITPENAGEVITEGCIAFIGVDNHKSRKVIADHCSTMKDVMVLSGGNDLVDGNVQLFVMRDGKKITANLDEYHPEIAEPKDKHPNERGCMDQMEHDPQIVFANATVACNMNNMFYAVTSGGWDKLAEAPGELYFDIVHNKVVGYERPPIEEAQYVED